MFYTMSETVIELFFTFLDVEKAVNAFIITISVNLIYEFTRFELVKTVKILKQYLFETHSALYISLNII